MTTESLSLPVIPFSAEVLSRTPQEARELIVRLLAQIDALLAQVDALQGQTAAAEARVKALAARVEALGCWSVEKRKPLRILEEPTNDHTLILKAFGHEVVRNGIRAEEIAIPECLAFTPDRFRALCNARRRRSS